MQILIGCAKDMDDSAIGRDPFTTKPLFGEQAVSNALQMMRYDEEELAQMLGCNLQIARQNRLRYLHFLDEKPSTQAVYAYTGIVFKYLDAASLGDKDFEYMQRHLWITSFLYGLLRPTDAIRPYRLEGNVVLPDNGVTMFDYWKPLLTDIFIESIKADGGVLLDVASNEMRRLFNWRKVVREVKVVSPEFLVRKNGRLKTVVVYAKMCRGALARYAVTKRMSNPEALKSFTFEGFTYSDADSKDGGMAFVLE